MTGILGEFHEAFNEYWNNCPIAERQAMLCEVGMPQSTASEVAPQPGAELATTTKMGLSKSLFCSICGKPTPNRAPLCDRCLAKERSYISAAENYMSATLLSWKGLKDNLERARRDVARFEQWQARGSDTE